MALFNPLFRKIPLAAGLILTIAVSSSGMVITPCLAQDPSLLDRPEQFRKDYERDTEGLPGGKSEVPDLLKQLERLLKDNQGDDRTIDRLKGDLARAEQQYGRSSVELLPILGPLIDNTSMKGDYREAARFGERALAIARKNYPARSQQMAGWLKRLGHAYKELSRFSGAEQLLAESIAIAEDRPGGPLPTFAKDLGALSEIYRLTGRYQKSLELKKRALSLADQANSTAAAIFNASYNITIRSDMATLLLEMGRFDEAEDVQRQALELAEQQHGPVSNTASQVQVALGRLYYRIGRYDDALEFFERALATQERLLGPDVDRVAITLNDIAQVYWQQSRLDEAKPLMERAIAILEHRPVPENYDLSVFFSNYGLLLNDMGKSDDAERHLRRAIAIDEKIFGPDHQQLAVRLINLSGVLQKQGKLDQAETLLSRAVSIAEKQLDEHPVTSRAIAKLARLDFSRGNWAAGYRNAARASAITSGRISRIGPSLRAEAGNLDRTGISDARRIFLDQIQGAARLAEIHPNEMEHLREAAFMAAQWGQNTMAAQAISQFAARMHGKSRELGKIIRELQDLRARWQAVDGALAHAAGSPPEARDQDAERDMRERRRAFATRIQALKETLDALNPAFAELALAEPVGTADIQSLLKPDEALIFTQDIEKSEYFPGDVLVWVLTDKEVSWVRSDLRVAELNVIVKALHCGLNAAVWMQSAQKCFELVGPRQSVRRLPFDYARAHRLYEALFGKVEDLIKGKHLFIVPSGALTQLPYAVLVKETPAGDDPKSTAWLIRDHAISILPAASSLMALRRTSRPSAASRTMIGFGNPLLDGSGANDRKRARLARQKQSCPREPSQTLAAFPEERRGVAAFELHRGLADLPQIRAQAPLPETADELCAVAHDIGADAGEMRLGAKATERAVKSLSAAGVLARYRVVHFATHGAMAGQLDNGVEPGLILTPPQEASEEDDGYLSAPEIAALKLDADLVILSACNTAAGNAASAEALSGIARAFFYAQARALLVSHWAVYSKTTVKLITGAMREIGRDKALGRAEALRRAMLDLIDNGEADESRPAFWAPFMVVGEGTR